MNLIIPAILLSALVGCSPCEINKTHHLNIKKHNTKANTQKMPCRCKYHQGNGLFWQHLINGI